MKKITKHIGPLLLLAAIVYTAFVDIETAVLQVVGFIAAYVYYTKYYIKEAGLFLNGIDAAAIVAQYGQYYLNQGQNIERVMSLIYQRSETLKYMKRLVVDGQIYQAGTGVIGSVVQQFQKSWTPKGTLTFTPNPIPLHKMKIDDEIDPDDIDATWLGFLGDMSKNDRKQWPIVRYMLEEHLLPMKEQDMELNAYYKGVYQAPQQGVAGDATKVLNGLRFQRDQIWNTGNPASKDYSSEIGPLDEADIFDQIETLTKKINDDFPVMSQLPMVLLMPNTWMKAYLRDKRNTHGSDVNYSPDKVTVDFYENFKMAGLPSMAGTGDIIVTPAKNLLNLVNVASVKKPTVENVDRKVKVYTDWWEAVGFAQQEYVFGIKGADTSSSGS